MSPPGGKPEPPSHPLSFASCRRGEPQAECWGAQATCVEAVSVCLNGRKPTTQLRLIRATATTSCHEVTELFLLPILFGRKCLKEEKNSGRINKELLQVGLQRPCCSLLVLSTAGLMQRFFLKTLRRGGEGFSTETLQTLCRPSCLYNTPILALEVFLEDKANGEIDKNKSLRGGKQWENRLFLLVTLPASAFTGVSELSLSLSSSMHEVGNTGDLLFLTDFSFSCFALHIRICNSLVFTFFTPPHPQTMV